MAPDRLGDGEVAHAIFDALDAKMPGMAAIRRASSADRNSPIWVEVALALSEAGLMVVRKGPDDI